MCPFYPHHPTKYFKPEDLKCDFLIGKDAEFKEEHIRKHCQTPGFKDCSYYYHLTKWLERIADAMKEKDE